MLPARNIDAALIIVYAAAAALSCLDTADATSYAAADA